MIKVLGLALYGPLAASTRYRMGQYVPQLANEGIELQLFHLLGDDYLRQRFSGGAPPVASMIRAGLARFKDLRRQWDYDAIMLHCELFPLLPGAWELALVQRPYIYDFDDAFYLKYRRGRLGALRLLLGSKFDKVMRGAAAITAGNYSLQSYASRYNSNTHYLPTVVDVERYLPAIRERRSDTFTVGWIGSPSTAPYLLELVEPLTIIAKECLLQVIVVGGKAPNIPNADVVEVKWEESTEVDLINSFDVGVMPLPDDDWARGKCAFKVIQYMACGVPVMASRVGANIDVVTGDCGLLVGTVAEWVDGLRWLRDEPEKRAQIGIACRERVTRHYSLRSSVPVLANIITEVALGKGANHVNVA